MAPRDPRASHELGLTDLHAALKGEPAAVERLLEVLTPVVQARVARALTRRPVSRGRDVAQDVADLSQEVFLALFSQDAKALKTWDPERGLSLLNFVGLLAERRVASLIRGRWIPTGIADRGELEVDEIWRDEPPPEQHVGSRLVLDQLLDALRSALSPRGLDLFYLVYVEERSVEDICEATGLTAGAVYQWKNRLGAVARAELTKIIDGRAAPPAPQRPRFAGKPKATSDGGRT
jgi:RNA polymerase sigma factor (sigma-70 family)